MGQVGDSVKVVDEDGHELPRARFDEAGRLIDPEGCVGEIVNVAGRGPFEGYYNNDEANARATRFGWYWSGDLGYIDESGFLYFAGRTADWIRVDGENFPSGPIEAVVARHPDVVFSAVYGVPDAQAGDQVMATLVLREGATFDAAGFGAWVDGQADLAPKWRPRYVRVTEAMPSTPTNKILKRTLVSEKFRSDRTGGDPLWMRDRDAAEYRPFTAGDEEALRRALVDAGRERFWDL
jgi:fatty-acyl-CoA synthase